MADHKQAEHEHQQLAALDVARRQHHRQRHQRHDPGIDREHQPDLGRGHLEALTDVTQQTDRHELGSIENEGRQGQREYAKPATCLLVWR